MEHENSRLGKKERAKQKEIAAKQNMMDWYGGLCSVAEAAAAATTMTAMAALATAPDTNH